MTINIEWLSKAELLLALESVPQGYWPPRPTQQRKAVLVDAVRRAFHQHDEVRDAVLRIGHAHGRW